MLEVLRPTVTWLGKLSPFGLLLRVIFGQNFAIFFWTISAKFGRPFTRSIWSRWRHQNFHQVSGRFDSRAFAGDIQNARNSHKTRVHKDEICPSNKLGLFTTREWWLCWPARERDANLRIKMWNGFPKNHRTVKIWRQIFEARLRRRFGHSIFPLECEFYYNRNILQYPSYLSLLQGCNWRNESDLQYTLCIYLKLNSDIMNIINVSIRTNLDQYTFT